MPWQLSCRYRVHSLFLLSKFFIYGLPVWSCITVIDYILLFINKSKTNVIIQENIKSEMSPPPRSYLLSQSYLYSIYTCAVLSHLLFLFLFWFTEGPSDGLLTAAHRASHLIGFHVDVLFERPFNFDMVV